MEVSLNSSYSAGCISYQGLTNFGHLPPAFSTWFVQILKETFLRLNLLLYPSTFFVPLSPSRQPMIHLQQARAYATVDSILQLKRYVGEKVTIAYQVPRRGLHFTARSSLSPNITRMVEKMCRRQSPHSDLSHPRICDMAGRYLA